MQPLKKTVWSFLKKLEKLHDPVAASAGIHPAGVEQCVEKTAGRALFTPLPPSAHRTCGPPERLQSLFLKTN